MKSRGKRAAIICGVGLAFVPLMLFAYLALHNRLLMDDYVFFGLPRDIGTWKTMLVWRSFWSENYSNFILYGMLAPLGASAPALFSLFLGASAFAAYSWLIHIVLNFLGIRGHRLAIVVALAALATAASINGLYHPQAFYWLTAAVVYHFPAAMLLCGIAAAIAAARRIQGPVQLLAAAIAAAVYAFICAGFSLMYVVFQAAAAALVAVFVFTNQCGSRRRLYRALTAALCLGTFVSLLLQASSPGFATRNAQPDYFGKPTFPARDLPDLIERALHQTLHYAGQPNSFAGFMLVACASLFLILSAGKPAPADAKPRKTTIANAPAAFALLVQLLFVPVLWTHRSDSLLILGRFSAGFALVVAINALAIAILLALLWRRNSLVPALNRPNGLAIYCGSILLTVGLIFALTQARDINFKAASYLFVCAVSLLILLAGQLASLADEPRLNALFRLSALITVGAFLILAAILAIKLWGLGRIVERTMSPVTYVVTLAGLLSGLSLGALIDHAARMTGAKAVWLRWIRLGCLLIVLAIGAGMTIGQGQRISQARHHAEIWDAAHQEIVKLRDAGDPAVYTTIFPRLLNEKLDVLPYQYRYETLKWGRLIYYDLLDGFESMPLCDCSLTERQDGDRTAHCAMIVCSVYDGDRLQVNGA